jgi:hypothetical protein
MSDTRPDESEIPIDIADEETIVRAVKTPAHYKKNKLATAVFRPRAGETSISVMRQIMGDDFCKAKAVDIGGNQYVGLLTIKASAIRTIGSTVGDSREEYLGHADLDHGFPSAPANDPAGAEDFARMTERCQELKNASNFHLDPAPAAKGWAGSKLKID